MEKEEAKKAPFPTVDQLGSRLVLGSIRAIQDFGLGGTEHFVKAGYQSLSAELDEFLMSCSARGRCRPGR
jgi:hypothetical protein